jgi:hypothetical protein
LHTSKDDPLRLNFSAVVIGVCAAIRNLATQDNQAISQKNPRGAGIGNALLRDDQCFLISSNSFEGTLFKRGCVTGFDTLPNPDNACLPIHRVYQLRRCARFFGCGH